MSHYAATYDPEAREWYFTSPAGRHAGRPTQAECERLIAFLLPRHIERANGQSAESAIFFDYFCSVKKLEEPKPPKVETWGAPCKEPFQHHRWRGHGPDAACARCGIFKKQVYKHLTRPKRSHALDRMIDL